MCTVSVYRDSTRLLVTMNRDESLSRGPESAPAAHRGGGAAWLGPGDADSGGTWIGVNDHGVAACLLNRYEAGPNADGGSLSRGGIIPELLGRGPLAECLHWLFESFRPRPYAPFDLIVTDPEAGVAATWDGGARLRRGVTSEGWSAATSSSWNREAVIERRMGKFRDWAAGPQPPFQGEIPTFNLLHEAGWEWWSPLVKRDRVETRSITQVEVDRPGGWLEIRYWPRPLRDLSRSARLSIPLKGALSTAG